MTPEAAGESTSPAAHPRVAVAQGVRVLVLGLLATGTVASLLLHPADVSRSQLADDLESGRVLRLQAGYGSNFADRNVLLGLYWADDEWEVRYVTAEGDRRAVRGERSSLSASDLEDLVERSPREVAFGSPDNRVLDALATASALVVVTLVALLAMGPQPRLATKWAWFWALLLPGAIGAWALVLADAPWSRTQSARPEPLAHWSQRTRPEGDRRVTGGWSFGVCVLGVELLLSLLSAYL